MKWVEMKLTGLVKFYTNYLYKCIKSIILFKLHIIFFALLIINQNINHLFYALANDIKQSQMTIFSFILGRTTILQPRSFDKLF